VTGVVLSLVGAVIGSIHRTGRPARQCEELLLLQQVVCFESMMCHVLCAAALCCRSSPNKPLRTEWRRYSVVRQYRAGLFDCFGFVAGMQDQRPLQKVVQAATECVVTGVTCNVGLRCPQGTRVGVGCVGGTRTVCTDVMLLTSGIQGSIQTCRKPHSSCRILVLPQNKGLGLLEAILLARTLEPTTHASCN